MEISVIIPSYKPSNYLQNCLFSLHSQSFSVSQFEIILVLNGVKKPYYDEIEKFCTDKEIVNIKVIYVPEANVSLARNKGIELARGDYITFIDDDDWVSENYLENLLQNAKRDAIVVSNVLSYNEDNHSYGKDYLGNAFANLKDESYSIFKYRKFMSSSCCKLIPKTIIKANRFNEGLRLGEDSLFMFQISPDIRNIVLASNDCIYYRRVRSNSVSQRKKNKRYHTEQRLFAIKCYLITYMKSIFRYQFLFFISRLIATIRHLFKG